MSNQQVGIRINLTENASSIAPRASQALGGVTSAAEKMKDALDIDELSQKYERFIDNFDDLDKLEKAQRILEKERTAKKRDEKEREVEAKKSPVAVKSGTNTAAGIIGQGSGILAGLGSSGDAMGASGDLLSMLGGTVGKLVPGVGAAVAAGTGILAGVTLKAGNALVKQYEGVMEESMDLAAALGKLGKSAEENSKAITDSMTMASDAASEFGYSIREGIGVGRGLAKHGVEDSGRLFEYARGFGVDNPMELVQYYGLGKRFDQEGEDLSTSATRSWSEEKRLKQERNILGLAAGGLEASGMSEGRFMEYLSATQQIFEDGISKGVLRGFDDISKTQNMLAGMGEMWKGSLGAQRALQMSGAVAGATALGKDTDVYLYRAASALSGGNTLDTMERLEKGLDSELLGAVVSELDQSIGRKDEFGYRKQLMEMFGLNYTLAGDLYDLIQKGDYETASAKVKEAPGTESGERDLLTVEEQIRNDVRLIGETLLEEKNGIMNLVKGATGKAEGMANYWNNVGDTWIDANEVNVINHGGSKYIPDAIENPGMEYDPLSDVKAWNKYISRIPSKSLTEATQKRQQMDDLMSFLSSDASSGLTNETLKEIDRDFSGKIDTKEEINALIKAINQLTVEMQKGVEVETPTSLGRGVPR